MIIQITLSAGRTLEQKRALYLVETAKENWSFGNGLASYAPAEAESA